MNEEQQQHEESNVPLSILDVIHETITNFLGFAHTHLRKAAPPSQTIVIWFLGMDAVAGGIELERLYLGEYMVDNWFHAWLRIMVGGFAVGVVRYWLVGTLFHGVVRIAGGKREPARTSRYIFLYAALPVAVVNLVVKVAQMLIYQNRYFQEQPAGIGDAALGLLMVGGFALSLTWGYLGMLRILGTDPRRSRVLLAVVVAVLILSMLRLGSG